MYKTMLSLLVSLAVVSAFTLFYYQKHKNSPHSGGSVILANIQLIGSTVIAYLLLGRTGLVHWWALPLGWMLCLLPSYIYVYHICRPTMAGNLPFVVIFVVLILPSGLASLILAGIDVYLRSKGG